MSSETALICDFAEFYHVLDWRAIPVRTAAALAAGLPDRSRSIMKWTGMKVSTEVALYATMVDRLNFLAWAKTKDAQKNRNRPVSILESITGEKADNDNISFSTADEFDRQWREIMEGGRTDGN